MSENQVASSFSFKIFERIKPDEYFRRFIEENVRPDGRALHTFRPTSIRQGAITTANGSAMVRIGGTTVVCGIKAEVAEPRVDRPKDGFLVPNVELSPICSANFRPGPPSEQAQVNAEIINQVLINCDIVDLSDLCIDEGKAVWSLYADILFGIGMRAKRFITPNRDNLAQQYRSSKFVNDDQTTETTPITNFIDFLHFRQSQSDTI
ncbi:hypothetical protein NQZ79_g793 [Umbelopsis isabellina]|nr:hypothetical protein NQZ79_g793 [Umbelopsis isabellina]